MKHLMILLVAGFAVLAGGPPAVAQNERVAVQVPGQVLADRVVVHKAARKMLLMRKGQVLRRYAIDLGFNPRGHKTRQGDGRTPVGSYIIDWRNPNSRFYLSLHISYPGPQDVARAASFGVNPGGDIMIHGKGLDEYGRVPKRRYRKDWTNGCIAVTNEQMVEIWNLVPDGTPIDIYP